MDAIQRNIAINVIQDVIEKKADIADPFMNRVPENIAKDYRQHVAAEMYIKLI